MTGKLVTPRVNIPTMIQQGDVASWFDEPFSDVGGVLYQSSGYTLTYTIADPSAPLSVPAAAQGTGWLTTFSAAQTGALTAGGYWWQAVLSAASFALTVAKGELVITTDLTKAGPNYNGNSEAAQNLAKWKAALAALTGTNGSPPVMMYRVNTREMRYQDIGSIIKAIAFWQAQVLKESTSESIAQGQGNPRKLYVRFPSRFGVTE